jgi:hypothetical protein
VAYGYIQGHQNKTQYNTEISLSGITGAMRTDTTAAMKVLPEPPPLHVMTEVEAQAWIYILMCNQ